MPQVANNWITAQDMVRSRAWRHGYEDFRRGAPLDYSGHRSKALAYEYGRLTAAYLRSRGWQLIRISTTRPISDVYVPDLAAALVECSKLQAADWIVAGTPGDPVDGNQKDQKAPGTITPRRWFRKGRFRLSGG